MKIATNISRVAMTALSVAVSMPVLAHPGPDHDHGFINSLVHLLTEPDHLAFIFIGAVVVAGLGIATGLGKTRKAAILEKLRALRKTI